MENLLLFLNQIESPNKERCMRLLEDNSVRFKKSPGSFVKHQAWIGGYVDHLVETMNMAVILYRCVENGRSYPFCLSDVILVLFLHDLEKPFKYVEPKTVFHSEQEKRVFINELIKKYKIILTEDQKNALMYIHGEGLDYSPHKRIQSPLAAFCHICDVFSARIWFDYPK